MPTNTRVPTFTDLVPLKTADTISKDDYHRNRIIYLFVDRVIDGCTFQGRHVPMYRAWKRKFEPLDGDDIADMTIGVNLYAVSCPSFNGGANGKAESCAKEAKEFLERFILHQVVRIKLLWKDKNKFATCQVETSKETFCFCITRKAKMDLSHELAKAGYATLNGNKSDAYREVLDATIKEAKTSRVGMWALDENFYSPAELKKRQKKAKSMNKLKSVKELKSSKHSSIGDTSAHSTLNGGSAHSSINGGSGHSKRSKRPHPTKTHGSSLGVLPSSSHDDDDDEDLIL